MRQLTEWQKKRLTEETVKYYNLHHKFPIDIDDIDDQAVDEIYEGNAHETFYQNANRLISDYVIDKVFMQADSRFV
jgi:hypothetical protein